MLTMDTFVIWTLLFFAYATLGWMGEMVYCSAGKGKLCEKRGFLNGFLCPVYGFGALLVLFVLHGGSRFILLTFLYGMLLTSALEYLTSWLMEKAFHMRWWDYSHYRFQLNGRVCLLNSTVFGLACVLLCHVAHPRLYAAAAALQASGAGEPLAFFFLGVFACDNVLSVRSAIQLGNRLDRLHEAQDQLKALLEKRTERPREWLENRQEARDAQREAAYAAELREIEQRQQELERRVDALRQGQDLFERRLLRSHPNLRSLRNGESLEGLRRQLAQRKNRLK